MYSSFEDGIWGVCGAATRFDLNFDEPEATGSSDFARLLDFGSLEGSGSDFGSLEGSGSDLGSDFGSADDSLAGSGEAGSAVGLLKGFGLAATSLEGSGEAGSAETSLDGSGEAGSDFGSDFGSAVTSLLGSGSADPSLEGSGTAEYPMSCNNGKFLHSAVSFFGLHPKPTHDVPFTTKTISISFCSFNILQ